MNKEEIKAKILFGDIRRKYALVGKSWFGWGVSDSNLTIILTDRSIIAKWLGLIKIRDIPLSDITGFEYLDKEKIYPLFLKLGVGIRILYNENGLSVEEYILGGRKAVERFLSALQGLKKWA